MMDARAIERDGALPSGSFWAGRRVLLTGHTGFKGAWLSIWLATMGAEVHGLALDPPTEPSLFDLADVASSLASDSRCDLRDYGAVVAAVDATRPDVVLHLAAQSLVRPSYTDPVGTYATNVMGTLHLLEAVRQSVVEPVIVNVTTDKVYENVERAAGYAENEPLGGYDPYSSSKAASEIVTASYRRSFLAARAIPIATARAGNVIGGGDRATDRLIPDAIRAFSAGEPVAIRNPGSVRPWQHVLDPITGYLLLAERLAAGGEAYAEAWNLGPDAADARPVEWVIRRLAQLWGEGASWRSEPGQHPHEAGILALEASKAISRLGWRPRWSIEQALAATVDWERHLLAGASARELCLRQIDAYMRTGRTTGD